MLKLSPTYYPALKQDN